MRRLFSWTSVILVVAACLTYAQQRAGEAISLPKLDGNSAKGLEIKCRLVKTRFVTGEPVNVWCTITNTTDRIKPVGWHPSSGTHFSCVPLDKAVWEGGLLPMAIPHLDRPIMIESKDGRPGYVLFIPAHESIQILLTHKEERPVKFKGRIVYDPLDPRNEGVVTDDGPPWRNELASSNEFEYEVVAAQAK